MTRTPKPHTRRCRLALLRTAYSKRQLGALCLSLLFAFLWLPLQADAVKGPEYLATAEAFSAALTRREPVIYVDDIAFSGEEAYISLTYNVRIIGKPERSTLSGVHFEILGTITAEPGGNVSVHFQDLCFDGGVNAADYDLAGEAPFVELFGSARTRQACIRASFGYFDASFTNCDFTRYASFQGAAVYCDNDIAYPLADRSFTFTGCRFYDNIAQFGTCNIFGDRVVTTATDCEFTGNYVLAQGGMSIANGAARLTNITVRNNHFVPYDKPNAQNNAGGGMYLATADLRAQGLVIENNTALWGGGLALVSPKSGNGEIILSDCRISGNTALMGGGALHINSFQGQPIYFRNCTFSDNAAPLGSSLYAVPYAAWNGKYTAGLLDFTFCTFTGNTAEDTAAFSFYEMVRPEQNGIIALHGCLVTDEVDRTAAGEEPAYTIIGASALEDASRVRIPQDVYAGWSQGAYAEIRKALHPGRNEALHAKGIQSAHETIAPAIPTVYGVCAACAVLLFLGYARFSGRRQPWLLLMLAAACVVNIGYLALSLSGSLKTALAANCFAYLGNAFQPMLMLLTVRRVCRLKQSRAAAWCLLLLAAAMFACAASAAFSTLFYRSVSYNVVDGIVTLTKDYGPLHTLFRIYILASFLAILGTVLYAILHKKVLMPRYMIITALAVSANLIIWLVGRLTRASFELLSVSYLITGLLLALLSKDMAEDDLQDTSYTVAVSGGSEPAAAPISMQPQASSEDADWCAACRTLVAQKALSRREGDVLLLLLQNRSRAEIAAELCITENTVKTHIANTYSKLNVNSRSDLPSQVIALAEAARSGAAAPL